MLAPGVRRGRSFAPSAPRPYRVRMLRLRLLPLLLALALTACAGSTDSQARENLREVQTRSLVSLQTGSYEAFAPYLMPEHRLDFLARAFGAEKKLHMTEFTTVGVDIAPDVTSARVVVRLSWYELPSTSVKTENLFIDWRRVEGGWRIERMTGGPLEVPAPGSVEAPPAPAPVVAPEAIAP